MMKRNLIPNQVQSKLDYVRAPSRPLGGTSQQGAGGYRQRA